MQTPTTAYLREFIHLSSYDLFPEQTDVKQADLNGDGTVNIPDITIVAAAYSTRPSDPKWNALADLDRNGQVNILDVIMVAKDYGKTA